MTSILLVEDDNNLRSVLSEELSEQGYEIYEACNGREALTVLGGASPNIILTDVSMPEMDGLELIQTLHRDYIGRFFIIAMTAGIGDTKADGLDLMLLKAADALGAERTIKKPFRMGALLKLLEEFDPE